MCIIISTNKTTHAPDGSGRKKEVMSIIFTNRYQAEKARRTGREFNGAEKIVKVYGGYVLMSAEEYRVWKMQK